MNVATAAADVIAYSAQLALVIGVCAGLPRLLGLRSPGVHYFFWRTLLAACVALPLVQPWQPFDLGSVSSTVEQVSVAGAGSRLPAQHVPAFGPAANGSFVFAALLVLALGAAARLAWLVLGLSRLRSLRASAPPAGAPPFDDLQATIGTRASIRWCDRLDHPVTFGFRNPVVLLPPSVASLPPAAARALVAHELFHVRRGDWAWLLLEEAIRAIFWFHPAVWWLVSRIQLAREAVVDELSILATNARRAYMDTLLTFAGDLPLSPVTAFSRRRHLFYRIMLLSQEGSMSSARLAAGTLVLCAVLGASGVAAARVFPLQQAPRDTVPGQLSPEQRMVLDKAVDQARDALAREPNAPDLHHKVAQALISRILRDSQLTSIERQSLIKEAIGEEDSALAIRPDYLEALRLKDTLLRMLAASTADPGERAALIAQAQAARDRADVIQLKTAPPPPPPPPAPSPFDTELGGVKPLRVGANIKPPIKVKDVRPVYPQEARDAYVQGVVIAEILVDGQGKVADARILRSVPMLDQAALDAVRQWEYVPVHLNGNPVPVIMTVTVNFTLQ